MLVFAVFRRWFDSLVHPGSGSTLKATSLPRGIRAALSSEQIGESLRRQAWSYRAIW
jgi:hypothetical protein